LLPATSVSGCTFGVTCAFIIPTDAKSEEKSKNFFIIFNFEVNKLV
jgi:hypothetical protein